jgi:hypothetical protein
MQDMIYLLATVGFFGLMWLFVIGCDRIIGPDEEIGEQIATPSETAVTGGRS